KPSTGSKMDPDNCEGDMADPFTVFLKTRCSAPGRKITPPRSPGRKSRDRESPHSGLLTADSSHSQLLPRGEVVRVNRLVRTPQRGVGDAGLHKFKVAELAFNLLGGARPPFAEVLPSDPSQLLLCGKPRVHQGSHEKVAARCQCVPISAHHPVH